MCRLFYSAGKWCPWKVQSGKAASSGLLTARLVRLCLQNSLNILGNRVHFGTKCWEKKTGYFIASESGAPRKYKAEKPPHPVC